MFEFNTVTTDEFSKACERMEQPFKVLRCGEKLEFCVEREADDALRGLRADRLDRDARAGPDLPFLELAQRRDHGARVLAAGLVQGKPEKTE